MKRFRDKNGNTYIPLKNGSYKMHSTIEDKYGNRVPYFSDDNEFRISVEDDGSKDYFRVPLNKFYQLDVFDMYIYPYAREKEYQGLRCISFFINEKNSVIDSDTILTSGYNYDYGFEIDRFSESLKPANHKDIIRFVFRDDLVFYVDRDELSSVLTNV